MPKPELRRPTVGRIVMFRHPVLTGLVLPGIVVATPESYAALDDKAMALAGAWDFPGFISDTDETDLLRVHLVVFTPSTREPTRELAPLQAPCFVQANVPYSEDEEPGTWGWWPLVA